MLMVKEVNLLKVPDESPRAFLGFKRSLHADKIASVASRCQISEDVSVAIHGNAPQCGDLVAVRVLTDQSNYDRLELSSGRMARLNRGDIVVGALGARRALKGYVGEIPKELALGDELHILNLGGVMGHCTGYHRDMSPPLKVEFLGYVTEDCKFVNMGDYALKTRPLSADPIHVPVIAVAGSCMHSGKTRAASELVRRYTERGYKVATGKLSGVACLKDTLEMKDHGAVKSLCFVDLGLPSTVGVEDLGLCARTIIGHLSTAEIDVVIVELGDGILGAYNVGTILDDPGVRQQLASIVFCAGDFVATWGGIELLKQKSLKPDVISGSVTDSRMGCDYVRGQFGIPAANALTSGQTLFSIVESKTAAWSQRCLKV